MSMPADPPDDHDSLHAKVAAIFAEFAGERAERLSAVRSRSLAATPVPVLAWSRLSFRRIASFVRAFRPAAPVIPPAESTSSVRAIRSVGAVPNHALQRTATGVPVGPEFHA